MCIYSKRACFHCSCSGPGPPRSPSLTPWYNASKRHVFGGAFVKREKPACLDFSTSFFACWHSSRLLQKKKANLLFYWVFLPKQNSKRSVTYSLFQPESQRCQHCGWSDFSSSVCLLMTIRGGFQDETRLSKFSILLWAFFVTNDLSNSTIIYT